MGWAGDLSASEQISIARQAIASVVESRTAKAETTNGHPAQPVFVTIEVDGTIRGCRGSLQARCRTLEEEIREAARSAAAFDPRYRPLQKGELPKFKVTVTLVTRLEPIQGVQGIGPEDGIVLKSGSKTGVVLPWEGKDAKVRLDWAYKKAGVSKGDTISLFRLIGERVRG